MRCTNQYREGVQYHPIAPYAKTESPIANQTLVLHRKPSEFNNRLFCVYGYPVDYLPDDVHRDNKQPEHNNHCGVFGSVRGKILRNKAAV